MHDHSELYQFITRYWWLIFPIGWGLAGLVRALFRHHEAQAALQVLKSYADQNREAPPEVMQLLRPPPRPPREPMDRSRGMLIAGLIFSALSVAFLVLRMTRIANGNSDTQAGLLFVTVLMAGFAIAMFIASYVFARDARPGQS